MNNKLINNTIIIFSVLSFNLFGISEVHDLFVVHIFPKKTYNLFYI